MISTSYQGTGFKELMTGLVELYQPKTIVELGTQQGASAITFAEAMSEGHLYTYDLFKERYDNPPYHPTQASLEATKKNIATHKLEDKITIRQKDALQAYKDFKKVDILHVDLCNYYDNVDSVLSKWYTKVNKLIILEGGVFNKWQRHHGFQPFNSVLQKPFIKNNYFVSILSADNVYAMTLLIRK